MDGESICLQRERDEADIHGCALSFFHFLSNGGYFNASHCPSVFLQCPEVTFTYLCYVF